VFKPSHVFGLRPRLQISFITVTFIFQKHPPGYIADFGFRLLHIQVPYGNAEEGKRSSGVGALETSSSIQQPCKH